MGCNPFNPPPKQHSNWTCLCFTCNPCSEPHWLCSLQTISSMDFVGLLFTLQWTNAYFQCLLFVCAFRSYWDFALDIDMRKAVYIHCHRHRKLCCFDSPPKVGPYVLFILSTVSVFFDKRRTKLPYSPYVCQCMTHLCLTTCSYPMRLLSEYLRIIVPNSYMLIAKLLAPGHNWSWPTSCVSKCLKHNRMRWLRLVGVQFLLRRAICG